MNVGKFIILPNDPTQSYLTSSFIYKSINDIKIYKANTVSKTECNYVL